MPRFGFRTYLVLSRTCWEVILGIFQTLKCSSSPSFLFKPSALADHDLLLIRVRAKTSSARAGDFDGIWLSWLFCAVKNISKDFQTSKDLHCSSFLKTDKFNASCMLAQGKSNSPPSNLNKKSINPSPLFLHHYESSGSKFRHIWSEFHGEFEFGTRLGPGRRNPARAKLLSDVLS